MTILVADTLLVSTIGGAIQKFKSGTGVGSHQLLTKLA